MQLVQEKSSPILGTVHKTVKYAKGATFAVTPFTLIN